LDKASKTNEKENKYYYFENFFAGGSSNFFADSEGLIEHFVYFFI